ncbi:MAG: carbon-nitrogen hydrolase family protein [Geminicoccaceae bacterium]
MVVQEQPALGAPEVNLKRIGVLLEAAARLDVAIALFPEMFLTGYNVGARIRDLAEPEAGAVETRLSAMARETGVALVAGLPQRRGEQVYNVALAIDRDGSVRARYAKMHLFGEIERSLFTAGREPVTASLAGHLLGLAICYDIEFPETGRMLAERNVVAIVVPTANMTPYWEVPTTLARARALENGVAVAYANLAGIEDDLTYTGLSAIVGPDGRDLARAGTEPAVLVADLGASLERARRHPPSTQREDLKAVV